MPDTAKLEYAKLLSVLFDQQQVYQESPLQLL
jgi:hypothetical protein